DGTAVTDEFRVNTTSALEQVSPAVAMAPDGSFVIAFQDQKDSDAQYDISARRFNATGQPIGDQFPVNQTTAAYQYQPSVGSGAGRDLRRRLEQQRDDRHERF